MKTFLKTLIGGAAGLGALYVVGKICYNLGKDVAEVERQLEPVKNEVVHPTASDGAGEAETGAETEQSATEEEPVQETKRDGVRFMDKIRNAKAFLKIKKALSSNKSPGVLGSLLKNPEGAKIEAFVQNGGVRINVRPGVT